MLEALHQLEIVWIVILQSIGAWLAPVMSLVSQLGAENFFMFIMPALYWCFDAILGVKVAILLLSSSSLNAGLKLLFHGPRPYWLSTQIRAFSTENVFGFPSNHAQTAVSVWGFLALRSRSKALQTALFLLVFLIGFSRIYLGVHFISDVLAGWCFGALLIWTYLRLERPLVAWLRTQTLQVMLILALVSAVVIASAALLPAALLRNWQMPQEWSANALANASQAEIEPLDVNGAFTVAGTWFGFMAGLAWMFHKQGGYRTDGTPQQRLLRYLVGLLGIFVFYFALGSILPRNPDLISYLLRFLRYTLVGLWVFMLAPLTFQKLGLAQVGQKQQ